MVNNFLATHSYLSVLEPWRGTCCCAWGSCPLKPGSIAACCHCSGVCQIHCDPIPAVQKLFHSYRCGRLWGLGIKASKLSHIKTRTCTIYFLLSGSALYKVDFTKARKLILSPSAKWGVYVSSACRAKAAHSSGVRLPECSSKPWGSLHTRFDFSHPPLENEICHVSASLQVACEQNSEHLPGLGPAEHAGQQSDFSSVRGQWGELALTGWFPGDQSH